MSASSGSGPPLDPPVEQPEPLTVRPATGSAQRPVAHARPELHSLTSDSLLEHKI